MLFGLDCLFEETKLSNDNLDCSVNQCIGLRATATNLAYIQKLETSGVTCNTTTVDEKTNRFLHPR